MIASKSYTVEPWAIRETILDLSLLAQSEWRAEAVAGPAGRLVR